MSPTVIAFEGPIGVGKTTLGRAVAERLDIGFIDGDAHCAPGPWLHSVLRTSRRIATACEEQLENRPAVIMAYPLRCTNWLFYRETFRRRGIDFHCIGLTADIASIATRERSLAPHELARAAQMISEGYGQRAFSDVLIRTDAGSFDLTCDRLVDAVAGLPGGRPG
ncbi:shikimate kinase [Marinovum sp. 2_MG-2023]|uniref:AAA family ATPase n=1 Tax=unclassified Marinovum TaxID=2647166 RepID=UPI0026E3B708|nr:MULTISPECIES: shikimate kinase [unclassified Marinovum]MDO6730139.1 shikimate kinase [Marinovum sp. 2_MG-2023]MDO6778877.1 shikimate kinase [Marinovum sp. 1_MG-2023]